jgi:hypothetical protein
MNPYEQAGVSRELLHRALRELGPTVLKPGLRVAWSSDNPTKNFCYYRTVALAMTQVWDNKASLLLCLLLPPAATTCCRCVVAARG